MNEIVLARHRLHHLRELKVDPNIFRARFPSTCSMANCTAVCCRGGVWVDVAEQRTIMQHAALIQAHMDLSQERQTDRWFDPKLWEHEDFPSGQAMSTAEINGGCVFLKADRRCVLQQASSDATGNLKPFYCVAFPITVDEGRLSLENGRDAACCTPTSDGNLTVFTLCAHELSHVLGDEGVRELEQHASSLPR